MENSACVVFISTSHIVVTDFMIKIKSQPALLPYGVNVEMIKRVLVKLKVRVKVQIMCVVCLCSSRQSFIKCVAASRGQSAAVAEILTNRSGPAAPLCVREFVGVTFQTWSEQEIKRSC